MNNAAGVCPTWKLTAPPGYYSDRQQRQKAQRCAFPLFTFPTCVWRRGRWERTADHVHLMFWENKVQETDRWDHSCLGLSKFMPSCKKGNTGWTSTREKGKLYTGLIARHAKACRFLPADLLQTGGSEPVALVQLVNLVWNTAECTGYVKTDTGETVMNFRITILVHCTLFLFLFISS